ncbi:MAG: cysteine desulfurase [Lentisphaeraceae bacterium]|nr:cysteine desulfurase [Lentisphaeraceae bacterium]
MSEKVIYLDNNATTPVDQRVVDAMLPFFTENYANAASFSHAPGREAADAVDEARSQIASLINAEAKDIIFTSGATESINLALKGIAGFYGDKGKHIIISAIEHKAVFESAEELKKQGFEVDVVGVDSTGRINSKEFEDLLRPETILVSFQHANNEIGTVQNLKEFGSLCRKNGSLFHVDAAQSFGKVSIDVEEMKIDLMSISGHKIYAPKGIGALYVRRKSPRVRLQSQSHGGSQEREFRAGTLNVPGIVALGKAAQIAQYEMLKEKDRLQKLTDKIISQMTSFIGNITFNGAQGKDLPGNLSINIKGVDARDLLCALPELALSTGSACSAAMPEPSHVLKAIGVTGESAASTFRIGLGRMTTEDDVEKAIELISSKIKEFRKCEKSA